MSENNITKYARGRDIDAIVDAQVNGTSATKAEVTQEPTVAASPAKSSGRAQHDAVMGVVKSVSDGARGVFDSVRDAMPSKMPTLRDLISDAGQADKVASIDGIATVRDGLGVDASKVSDAELKSALGSDVIAQIGKEGFPHDEVAGIQKEFGGLGLDKVAALQTYVEACNSAPGEQIHLCDQKGETVASLNPDKVLEAAGLDRSAVDQARGADQQNSAQREEVKMAAAETQAAMSMG